MTPTALTMAAAMENLRRGLVLLSDPAYVRARIDELRRELRERDLAVRRLSHQRWHVRPSRRRRSFALVR